MDDRAGTVLEEREPRGMYLLFVGFTAITEYVTKTVALFPNELCNLESTLTCLSVCFQTDLNEVEQLLEKHSNFEKLVNTQEERFLALERLTTVIYGP